MAETVTEHKSMERCSSMKDKKPRKLVVCVVCGKPQSNDVRIALDDKNRLTCAVHAIVNTKYHYEGGIY